MDEALEEFEDYINLGIKPKPLQGPDLKSTSKIKTNPKIKKEVERERKEGWKVGPLLTTLKNQGFLYVLLFHGLLFLLYKI